MGTWNGGSPVPWRTCQKADVARRRDAIADRMLGMGDHRPAVGRCRTIGQHCRRSAHLMSALTQLWTVIFLVSYIEADWSSRLCTAGSTQWNNYGYQLTVCSLCPLPLRYATVLCFAASASVHLVCGPRPLWSNKRLTDSKRWATGDNYPAHSRPVVGRRQSRFSEVEKFLSRDREEKSIWSLINIPSIFCAFIYVSECTTMISTSLCLDVRDRILQRN